MGAQPKQKVKAKYEIRHPKVDGYRKLSAGQVNRFGDLLEGIKRSTDPSEWFDTLIEKARSKRCVAHKFIPWDAEAALKSAQRAAARQAFAQFVPISQGPERKVIGSIGPPTVIHATQPAVDNGKPTKGPVDFEKLVDAGEAGRREAIRLTVKKVSGYLPWVARFEELQALQDVILLAMEEWDVE